VADLSAVEVQAILNALTPELRAELKRRRREHNAQVDGVFSPRMSIVGWCSFWLRHGLRGPLWHAMSAALEAHRLASEDEDLREPGSGDIEFRGPESDASGPSASQLIQLEFRRRVRDGELESSLTAQAKVLRQWLIDTHNRMDAPEVVTIQNNIRKEYRGASPRNP
jgi:hypothetical protein